MIFKSVYSSPLDLQRMLLPARLADSCWFVGFDFVVSRRDKICNMRVDRLLLLDLRFGMERLLYALEDVL